MVLLVACVFLIQFRLHMERDKSWLLLVSTGLHRARHRMAGQILLGIERSICTSCVLSTPHTHKLLNTESISMEDSSSSNSPHPKLTEFLHCGGETMSLGHGILSAEQGLILVARQPGHILVCSFHALPSCMDRW